MRAHTHLKLTVVFGEIITNEGKNLLTLTGKKTKSYLSEVVSVRASARRYDVRPPFVILIQEEANSPPPPLYVCTYPRLLLPAVMAIWR